MISTSGHLIPKFPEVRFHRTRIFNYILGVSDVKRSLPGELIVNETIDEYFDLVEVYKRLDQYDQELVWALLQEIRKTAEKRKRNEKDAEDSHM